MMNWTLQTRPRPTATANQHKVLYLLRHHEDKNIALGLRLLESRDTKDSTWILRHYLGADATNHQAHKKLLFLLKEMDDGLAVNLPPERKNLPALYLGASEIHHLPKSVTKLIALKKLYLWGNKLTSLPECIGKLKQLEVLHLGCNKLSALPASLRKLKNLQRLYLWANHLAELPVVICELPKLQTLHLGNNELNSLPDAFGHLQNLRELDLSLNNLKTIPSSLGELKELRTLYLSGNPLSIDTIIWLREALPHTSIVF